ncbi:MAG: hypothetical protein ACRYF4_01695 [Janthinobacterium lividum]
MSGAPGTTAEVENRQEARFASGAVSTEVVICLGPWYEDASADHLMPLLTVLHAALGDHASQALVAYPVSNPQATSWEHGGMLLQPYLPTARLHTWLVQAASTYLSLFEVMRAHSATCGLLLGPEPQTLQPAAIRAMLDAVLAGGADLAVAKYQVGPNHGLINAAILHPLSRALFATKVQFPLALDIALSQRMAERLAAAAQRLTTSAQPDAIVWAVSEAANASFAIAEVEAGERDLPRPDVADLSNVLEMTAASMFSDIEAKATFWQRARTILPLTTISAVPPVARPSEPVPTEEVEELVESFRLGYGNLHEIWSLFLPPQTLLGLKRLSTTPSATFKMPDALWVRIVYDFVLAHRLRTINRSHLLGSLTPLYLAWVASHILAGQADAQEALARAFEADKPYLVSRWRWPDRFNP